MTLEMASETASETASKMASETSTRTFEAAISSFKESISLSPEDALAFQGTSLQDLLNSLKEIQLAQGQTKSFRNMSRLQPFLSNLESFSKAIEVFCNGDPYIPWLWVVVPSQFKVNKVY
jgi:hypothetical protein